MLIFLYNNPVGVGILFVQAWYCYDVRRIT